MINTTFRKATALLLAASCLSTAAHAQTIGAISGGNTIVSASSTSPSTGGRSAQITGLGAGQSIIAFDARPAVSGRVLYGLSNTGQLYAINARTGAASAVGAPIALQGTSFGFDFNPTVDRIRIVSNTGQNLRVDPNTGAVITDANLNVLVGGRPIRVSGNTAAAYTNNVPDATTTTLFVINTQTGLLQIQNPPNAGTLNVVGGLGGIASGTVSGFDISAGGQNRVSVIQNGVTNLFSVDLQTGRATLIGRFGTGALQGLAFLPDAFAEQANLTANQRAVAGAFDNFTTLSPGLIPFLTNLDAIGAQGRANAFNQLSPAAFGILPEAILQTKEFVDTTVRDYLRDVRHGGAAGMAVADPDRAIGGFIVGAGRTGEFRARGDRNEVEYGASGFIAGADLRLAPTSVIGISGGYDEADVRLTRFTPNSRAETWYVGGYGTFGLGPVFVDVAGSYGETDLSLRRNVAFGNFSNNASAEGDARYYSIAATTGLSLDMAGFELEPYAGARYADVKIDAFSEGPGLTSLSVGRQDVESLQSILGLHVAAKSQFGGATIRPYVRGEYRHEFENDEARLISASFNGGGINAPFTTTTTPMGDDQLAVGAGLTISGDSPIGVMLDYHGHFLGGYEIHGVKVGVRVRM